jgi:CRP/FNR family transcriptional regulator, cyclic AMP receptor protein
MKHPGWITRMNASGWFSTIPDQFKTALLNECRFFKHSKGAIVVHTDDPPAGIFCVIDGCVAAAEIHQHGEVVPIHLSWPGECFGVFTFITNSLAKAEVRARTDSALALFPNYALHRMLQDHPEWWRDIARLSTRQTRFAMIASLSLMLRSPRKRCVATLLRLIGSRTSLSGYDGPIVLPISQEELSIISNLSRNTAGEILRSLKMEGLIALQYRAIKIHSPVGLQKILDDEDD